MATAEIAPEDVATLMALVREQTGLTFPASRHTLVLAGIRRAMQDARIHDGRVYLQHLQTSPDRAALMDGLFAELTVGETYFFRDPGQLDVVRTVVLPEFNRHSLQRPAAQRGIRIWSAGCASGEETYSLAMMLLEAEMHRDAYLIGTDISRHRLRAARRGIYRQWSMRGMSPERMLRYFVANGSEYELVPAVRDMADFRYLNLGLDHYPSPALGVWGMDLILCRNVLIYFDTDAVTQVAKRLLDSLSLRGWLFLGPSDPLLSDLVECDVEITDAGLAYRRRQMTRPRTVPVTPQALPEVVDYEPVREAMAEYSVPEVEEIAEPPADDADIPPPSAAASIETAFADRDYELVVKKASRKLEADPADEPSWILLIQSLANLGRSEDAERHCISALDRHPTSSPLWYLQAVLLSETGRYTESIQAARRAIYLDRALAVAHLVLGNVLRKTGDLDGAFLSIGNAIRLLERMAPDAIVPASGGERCDRILTSAKVQSQLMQQSIEEAHR